MTVMPVSKVTALHAAATYMGERIMQYKILTSVLTDVHPHLVSIGFELPLAYFKLYI